MIHDSRKSHDLFVVLTVGFAAFMVNVDNYIVVVAVPTITRSFGIDTGTASWISMGYLVPMVSAMLIMGRVTDRIGVKTVFITGYVIFTFASLLCGISPSIHWLVFSRVLQGIGGCMLYVGGFAMIPHYLPQDRNGWAFGIASTAAGLGMMAGAPLGGIITQYLSWRWAFLINLPVGVVAVLWTSRLIPAAKTDRRPRGASKKFDVLGSFFSAVGLLAVLFGISGGQERGWHSLSTLACFGAASVFLSVFIIHQKRQREPLINLTLFRVKNFTRGIIAGFSVFLFFAGADFLLPFYLQLVKGLTNSQTGLAIMTYSLVYLAIAPLSGRLSDRMNPLVISTVGLSSASAACIFFALSLHWNGIGSVIIFLAWLAVSLGFFFSPNNKLLVDSIPEEHQGVGIAAFWTINHLGILLGICLYETIFSAALPGNLVIGSLHGDQAIVSGGIMLRGFRNAFLIGGVVGLIAAAFSLFMKSESTNDRISESDYPQQHLLSPGGTGIH